MGTTSSHYNRGQRAAAHLLEKTMGDTETFKLVIFLIGNGCEPSLIRRWTMLAQHWAESTAKAEKRVRQVDFVLNNTEQKNSCGSSILM